MYSKVVLKVSNEVIDDVNDLFEGTATIKLTWLILFHCFGKWQLINPKDRHRQTDIQKDRQIDR